MWEIIAAVSVVFFAIIGFVTFIRTIIFRLYKPKSENSMLIIGTKDKSTEDIEYTLISWAQRVKWLGKGALNSIIIADSGLDTESKEICRRICKEYEFMQVVEVSELCDIICKKNT